MLIRLTDHSVVKIKGACVVSEEKIKLGKIITFHKLFLSQDREAQSTAINCGSLDKKKIKVDFNHYLKLMLRFSGISSKTSKKEAF